MVVNIQALATFMGVLQLQDTICTRVCDKINHPVPPSLAQGTTTGWYTKEQESEHNSPTWIWGHRKPRINNG